MKGGHTPEPPFLPPQNCAKGGPQAEARFEELPKASAQAPHLHRLLL